MGIRSTQGFVVNVLTDCSFDQIAASQKNRSRSFDDQGLIAHDGQVGPSCYARSHDSCNLGNAHSAHARIVSKHATKVLLVGKDLALQWQEYASTVNEINDRDAILHGDFLRAQVLFARDGKPCTGFNRCVIGDGNNQPLLDVSDLNNDSTGRTPTVFRVHAFTS